MKKTLLSLIVTFFAFQAQAQIVNIPDANFKQALLNIFPSIDSNNNNEIEVSEALTLTTLELNTEGITDLSGLEAFQNLTVLKLNYVQVNNLNVNNLVNLTELWIFECSAQQYALNNLVNLEWLVIANTAVPNLDVSNLTNLQTLAVQSCSLTNLNISNLSQLTILNCGDNQLTNVTLPTNNNIETYNCYSNLFTSIDLNGFNNLKRLNCNMNPFTSSTIANNATLEEISCEGLTLNSFGFQNLPSIKKINVSNGQLTSVDVSQIPSLQELKINNNLFTDLSFTNLPNLTTLNCDDNQLVNLNLANLPSLLTLYCSDNQLTNLNLTPVPQLKTLSCFNNLISSFDFSTATALENLNCSDNPLTGINFTGLTNLITLNFGNPNLSQIQNLAALSALKTFRMTYGTFETIDLSPLQSITRLEIYNTTLTSLDFSANTQVTRLALGYNYNLEYLNSNNGRTLSSLATGFPEGIRFCPNLTKVCTAQPNIAPMNYVLTSPSHNNNIVNPLILPYCNFAPNGAHNTVTGTVTFDLNNNGCNANDILVRHAKLNLAAGSAQSETITDYLGVYNFYPLAGNYTLSPNLGNDYFTITPPSVAVSFADINNNVVTQDFCLTANGVKNDLNIEILPYNNAIPGFHATYRLVYKNTGNQTLSGSVTLSFNDNVMNLVPNSSTPDVIGPNSATWYFSNLQPFESRSVFVQMNLNSPTDSPALNGGDVLNFTATANPLTGDETPNDNVFNLSQTVVNSYDPNDKICLEGSSISPSQVGDYLHYMIRFQNTGTANAQNVVVKDIIDTAKLDTRSLQFIESSHLAYTRITNNMVEFIFESINLPTETADEPNSHGFVAFKMKPKNNLVLGNTIENKAEIYFDFNFPIVTNTTSTTIALLNVNHMEDNAVSVAPVPVKDVLQIKAKVAINRIEVFDIQGRLMFVKIESGSQMELNFAGNPAGIYLVKIYTDNGVKTQKVIKE